MAAHHDADLFHEAMRERWQTEKASRESALTAMQDTIGVVEREMKKTAAALEKAETDERRGGFSSTGTAADLELMLGQLEDKFMRTQAEVEEARRLSYFPAVDGYQLRFSYKETFLGLKEMWLERLCGSLALTATPASATSEAARVELRIGQMLGATTAAAGGKDAGASFRFAAEGVSVVSRRELLGVAVSPNINLSRVDVSARFVASLPFLYLPKRRTWRAAPGFKIALLHFSESGGSGGAPPEPILRLLVQVMVERPCVTTTVTTSVTTSVCNHTCNHICNHICNSHL
jgi:hypothetical protein